MGSKNKTKKSRRKKRREDLEDRDEGTEEVFSSPLEDLFAE